MFRLLTEAVETARAVLAAGRAWARTLSEWNAAARADTGLPPDPGEAPALVNGPTIDAAPVEETKQIAARNGQARRQAAGKE